jgi:hypothetical protein
MKSIYARRAAIGVAAGMTMIGGMVVSLSAAAANVTSVPSFSQAPMFTGESDFCVGQPDGAYQHPDCRVYYRCSHGTEAQMKCPEGEVFDPNKNPNDVEGRDYCGVPQSVANADCSDVKMVKQ